MNGNNAIISGFDNEKNEYLQITLHNIEGVEKAISFELKGIIDTYNSQFFTKHLDIALNQGYKKIMIIMFGISYVSSTGIGAFANIFKNLRMVGGDLSLVGVQPKVMEVFQLLGFEQFFNFSQSREEAFSFFAHKNMKPTLFPKVVDCPICSKKLKTPKPGKFRCPSCKTILAFDDKAQMFLG